MKELKIMKALRYILIVVSLLSVLNTNAQVSTQDWGKQPEAQMHSTSAMVGSGSTLPSAAITGVSTTYSPTNAPSRPRRIGENEGFEDEGDEPATGNPGEPFPIGDAMWPLAILACAYLILRATRKRKSAMSK